MSKQKKQGRVAFRRVRGRVVPIRIKDEAASVQESLKQGTRTGALPKIGAIFGAGAGAIYGAGRLSRSSGKIANKTAKVMKFAGKWGAALAIGHQLTRIDIANKKDEKAKLTNLGSGGSIAHNAGRLAIVAAGTYAGGRVFKRFEKWGARGGKFPFKLKDI